MSGGWPAANLNFEYWWSPSAQYRQVRLREIEMLSDNPGRLRMLLYVPKHLRVRSPLVVVLHGGSQNAEEYADGAGWLTLAERYGFAVLCPQQTLFNNANLSFNWFQPSDVARKGGEADSICQMVALAIALHNFDAERIFITGVSAGGAMTAAMLATYPDVFAAGAVIAGLPYGTAENLWEALVAMAQVDTRSDQELGDKVRAASPNSECWPSISIWQRLCRVRAMIWRANGGMFTASIAPQWLRNQLVDVLTEFGFRRTARAQSNSIAFPECLTGRL